MNNTINNKVLLQITKNCFDDGFETRKPETKNQILKLVENYLDFANIYNSSEDFNVRHDYFVSIYNQVEKLIALDSSIKEREELDKIKVKDISTVHYYHSNRVASPNFIDSKHVDYKINAKDLKLLRDIFEADNKKSSARSNLEEALDDLSDAIAELRRIILNT